MSTKLQKVFFGTFSVTFFLLLCQGARMTLQREEGQWACNSGGIFGVAIPEKALTVAILGALFLFGVQWWKESDVRARFFWTLVLAGGTSNLFERILFGCVTDYILLPYISTFNIADTLLTIGVGGVLLSLQYRNPGIK